MRRAQLLLAVGVLLLLASSPAAAFPSIYVARYAKECTDHPTSDYGKVHEFQRTADNAASFALTSASTGKAVAGKVCAGDSYSLQVDFGEPSKRNYLLSSSHGTFSVPKNDCEDAWCPNRLCSTEPATQAKAVWQLPCDTGAGKQVTIKVTSANGRIPATGSTLRTVALTVEVEGACPGKCGSKSSSNSSSPAASKSDKTITESGNSGGAGSSSSSSMSSSSSIKKVNAAFRQKKQGP